MKNVSASIRAEIKKLKVQSQILQKQVEKIKERCSGLEKIASDLEEKNLKPNKKLISAALKKVYGN
jgi:hypothetical protein